MYLKSSSSPSHFDPYEDSRSRYSGNNTCSGSRHALIEIAINAKHESVPTSKLPMVERVCLFLDAEYDLYHGV